MSNVTRLRHALPMSPDINKAIADLDSAIAKAVDAAKVAGLTQGLVVSLLHGHAQVQTNIMVSGTTWWRESSRLDQSLP